MIITMIFVLVLALGIGGMVAYGMFDTYNTFSEDISPVLVAVGSVFFILCIIIIICTHSGVDASIYEKQIQYESLLKQSEVISSEYEDVSKTDVIQRVAEWNINVHSEKYCSENPWTNWFWSKEYVDSLQYIELDE